MDTKNLEVLNLNYKKPPKAGTEMRRLEKLYFVVTDTSKVPGFCDIGADYGITSIKCWYYPKSILNDREHLVKLDIEYITESGITAVCAESFYPSDATCFQTNDIDKCIAVIFNEFVSCVDGLKPYAECGVGERIVTKLKYKDFTHTNTSR